MPKNFINGISYYVLLCNSFFFCLTFNPWDSFTLLHVVVLQLFSLLYNILSHSSTISTYSFMVDLLIDIQLLLFFSFFLVVTYMSLFSPWIYEQFFFFTVRTKGYIPRRRKFFLRVCNILSAVTLPCLPLITTLRLADHFLCFRESKTEAQKG